MEKFFTENVITQIASPTLPHRRQLIAEEQQYLARLLTTALNAEVATQVVEKIMNYVSYVEKRMVGRMASHVEDLIIHYLMRYFASKIEDAPDAVHMEIGTLFGGTVLLAHHATSLAEKSVPIHIIDPFEGYYGRGKDIITGEEINEQNFLKNLGNLNIPSEDIVIHKGLSTDPAIINECQQLRLLSLLIDGDHTYNGIKNDWLNFAHLVVPGGYVLVDNYNDQYWPDVMTYMNREVLPHARGRWEVVLVHTTSLLMRRTSVVDDQDVSDSQRLMGDLKELGDKFNSFNDVARALESGKQEQVEQLLSGIQDASQPIYTLAAKMGLLEKSLQEEIQRSGKLRAWAEGLQGEVQRLEGEHSAKTAKLEKEKQILLDEKQTFLSEKQALMNEKQTLVDEKQALTAEQQTLTVEKHALTAEKQTLMAEKQALTAEKQALTDEKQSLMEEKQTLVDEKQALTTEQQTLTVEKNALTAEKQALTDEKQALTDEKQSLMEEKQSLMEEKQSLMEEKQSLIEVKQTLTVEKHALTAEKQTLMAEKQTLTDEKQALMDEKHALTDEKQTLNAEMQTLTVEMQSLMDEKQSLISENQVLTDKMQSLLTEQQRILDEKMTIEREYTDRVAQLNSEIEALKEVQEGELGRLTDEHRILVETERAAAQAKIMELNANHEDLHKNYLKALSEVDRIKVEYRQAVLAHQADREQLQGMEEELRDKVDQINDIHNSMSWKITAPIRAIAKPVMEKGK